MVTGYEVQEFRVCTAGLAPELSDRQWISAALFLEQHTFIFFGHKFLLRTQMLIVLDFL